MESCGCYLSGGRHTPNGNYKCVFYIYNRGQTSLGHLTKWQLVTPFWRGSYYSIFRAPSPKTMLVCWVYFGWININTVLGVGGGGGGYKIHILAKVQSVPGNCWIDPTRNTSSIFSDYRTRLSRIWRILQIKEGVIYRGPPRSAEFFISYESRIQ